MRGVVPVMGMAASRVMPFALCAARHREVGRDSGTGPPFQPIDLWNGADHGAGVEHLVVEREIVRRNDADAELVLARPVGGAKPDTGLDQGFFVGSTGPKALQREFQLAARTDARRAEGGDGK